MSLFEELLLTEVGLALDADDPGIENVSGEFDVLFEDEDGPTYGNNSLGSKRLYKERLAYLEQNTYTDHYNSVFNNIASGGPGKPHGYKPNSISFHHPLFKHYMKIDNDGNAIVPKIDKLTQITTGDKQYFAFNFVADAFGDFVKYINENKKNQLSEDSFLGGEISAKKAWQNYEDFYENMLNGLFRGYVSSFLRDEKENQRVVNYATFLDSFLNKYYPSIADSIPLTMTSLVESNLLSPNSTGLCVELFSEDHSEDFGKFIKYLNNSDYTFYTLAAQKFGFVVDDNAPWRLVANLNSPIMLAYVGTHFFSHIPRGDSSQNLDHYHIWNTDHDGNGTTSPPIPVGDSNKEIPFHRHGIHKRKILEAQKYGNKTIASHRHRILDDKLYKAEWSYDDYYEEFFTKTFKTEVYKLKVVMENFYKKLIKEKPTVVVKKLCSDNDMLVSAGNKKYALVFDEISRAPLSDAEVNSKFNNLFWIKAYFLIRAIEKRKGSIKVDLRMKKVMQKINKIYFFLDNGPSAAIAYVNDILKQYY